MSRSTYSHGNYPVIATRSDDMGVATVNKLSPTRALLVDRHKNWILVTPKDTFNNSTLDLTEKLHLRSKVAFKSNRLVNNSTYNAIAVYVRPVSECLIGEAVMTEISPTYGYANSANYGNVFFPVSAIVDPIITEPYMRRHHDLSKCMRLGDPISFVAVTDESTKNRSAFAVEVQLAFNKVEGKPMLGIITKLSHSTCTVWAKNFPVLPLEPMDFNVDTTVDLRKIFTEGDRITFTATQIGCGIGGVTEVAPVDPEHFAKLEWARANMKESGIESGASGSISNASGRSTGAVGYSPRYRALLNSMVADGVDRSSEEELNSVYKELEEELDCITDSSIATKDSDLLDIGQARKYGAALKTGGKFPAQSSGSSSSVKGRNMISKIQYADAEVQTGGSIEMEAVRIFLQDKDIFSLACNRYPGLMRDLIRFRRAI